MDKKVGKLIIIFGGKDNQHNQWFSFVYRQRNKQPNQLTNEASSNYNWIGIPLNTLQLKTKKAPHLTWDQSKSKHQLNQFVILRSDALRRINTTAKWNYFDSFENATKRWASAHSKRIKCIHSMQGHWSFSCPFYYWA